MISSTDRRRSAAISLRSAKTPRPFRVEVDQHLAAGARRLQVHRLAVPAIPDRRSLASSGQVHHHGRPFDRHVERDVQRRRALIGPVEQVHPERAVLEQQAMNNLRRDVLPLGAQLQRRGPGVDRLDVSAEKDRQRTQAADRNLEGTRLAFGGDRHDVGGQAGHVQIDQRGPRGVRIRRQPLLDQGRLDRGRDCALTRSSAPPDPATRDEV